MSNKAKRQDEDSLSDRRLTEIDYHTKLNLRIVVFILPVFLFFAIFYYHHGVYLQAVLFSMLLVNAVTALALTPRMPLKHRIRFRHVTVAIAFVLIACSILAGILSGYIYVALPYIFGYPLALTLFFGQRAGFYSAAVFCAIAIAVVLTLDFPPWTAADIKWFKMNAVLELITILAIALISENTRVRIRDKLIMARDMYKSAEARQRETNLELKREIELRTESQKALAHSEQRYRTLFEDSAVSLWEEDWSEVKIYLDGLSLEAADPLLAHLKNDPKGLRRCVDRMRVTAVNRATLRLWEADSILTLLNNIRQILPPASSDYMAQRLVALYKNGRYDAELTTRTINGRKIHVMIGSTVPSGYEDSWRKIFTSVYDVTEKMAISLEKQRIDHKLEHSRQFQAIGSLAGGIAHQFNNALAVIVGNLDLLERHLQMDANTERYMSSLRTSAEHVARLTAQLLAYAQGGKYQPKVLSVNALIQKILNTNTTLGRATHIVPRFGQSVYLTSGDTTQIRTVLEAVLYNAVEATNEDGEIFITTRNHSVIHFDAELELRSGAYAAIIIEDNGAGMDAQTCQRIFEPFFSTKFIGRGLAMAAAFGIVKNHNGAITVISEPGKGTRVTIYLPAVENQHDPP